MSIFVSGGNKERKKWCTECCAFCHFLIIWKINSHQSYLRGLLNTSTIWYGVGSFLVRPIMLFPIHWIFMILLNMDLRYWRLVLKMFLSLRDMMKCNLLYFTVSCWIEMAYKTCWNVVGSFLKMLRIQTLVLFLSVREWLHGMLFVDWEIYDMLWC